MTAPSYSGMIGSGGFLPGMAPPGLSQDARIASMYMPPGSVGILPGQVQANYAGATNVWPQNSGAS